MDKKKFMKILDDNMLFEAEIHFELHFELENLIKNFKQSKAFNDIFIFEEKRRIEEFGFEDDPDNSDVIELSFDFGSIKIRKEDFEKALKRYRLRSLAVEAMKKSSMFNREDLTLSFIQNDVSKKKDCPIIL